MEQQLKTQAESSATEISNLHQRIGQISQELDDAYKKNKELDSLIREKSVQFQDVLKNVQHDCLEKSAILEDNQKLDDIIGHLEKRNEELSTMLGEQVYSQAEEYKMRLFQKLSANGSAADKDSVLESIKGAPSSSHL